MIQILRTDTFDRWLLNLRDFRARSRIEQRLDRLAAGNPGTVRALEHGVLELKVDYGPGYRVYYVQRGAALVLLLCGGDKRTQNQDIKRAVELAKQVKTWLK